MIWLYEFITTEYSNSPVRYIEMTSKIGCVVDKVSIYTFGVWGNQKKDSEEKVLRKKYNKNIRYMMYTKRGV